MPSGSGIAVTPMYEPGLISDIAVLATPNTATLSVMRTFMSVPSRDLIISMAPSTLSMVPRIRTGGGCCAHATDPSTDMTVSDATSARGSNEEILGMALSSQGCFWFLQRENTATSGLFHGECCLHIGGVSPSRPTLTRLVSNEPSGSFFMKAITLAPAFRSDLSAGT